MNSKFLLLIVSILLFHQLIFTQVEESHFEKGDAIDKPLKSRIEVPFLFLHSYKWMFPIGFKDDRSRPIHMFFGTQFTYYSKLKIPIGLEMNINMGNVNKIENRIFYSVPENEINANLVRFSGSNQIYMGSLSLKFSEWYKKRRIQPYLSAGIGRLMIRSTYTAIAVDAHSEWHREGIPINKSSSMYFDGNIGIDFNFWAKEDKSMEMLTLRIGMSYLHSFSSVDFINLRKRQACQSYTNGTYECPVFEGEDVSSYQIIHEDISFHIAAPSYKSRLNLLGIHINFIFKF